ncbi:hypothetical protein HBB16_08020 [Pseudonocardia sp. MCCB 268]|nr:hypothetical protein [Pseudonocardia cytotoxica]
MRLLVAAWHRRAGTAARAFGYLLVSAVAAPAGPGADPGGSLIGHVTADAAYVRLVAELVPVRRGARREPAAHRLDALPHGLNVLREHRGAAARRRVRPGHRDEPGRWLRANAAVVLGPVVSGLLLAVALRPYVGATNCGRIARGIAGGLHAFSPFHSRARGRRAPQLTWSVLPPLPCRWPTTRTRARALERPCGASVA